VKENGKTFDPSGQDFAEAWRARCERFRDLDSKGVPFLVTVPEALSAFCPRAGGFTRNHTDRKGLMGIAIVRFSRQVHVIV
jgi:hypothetical protein